MSKTCMPKVEGPSYNIQRTTPSDYCCHEKYSMFIQTMSKEMYSHMLSICSQISAWALILPDFECLDTVGGAVA